MRVIENPQELKKVERPHELIYQTIAGNVYAGAFGQQTLWIFFGGKEKSPANLNQVMARLTLHTLSGAKDELPFWDKLFVSLKKYIGTMFFVNVDECDLNFGNDFRMVFNWGKKNKIY